MTVSIWQADGTQPIYEVDFLIVGAGIVGTAAAIFAAQAGRQVTITDMRDVALGASSRNAGFMLTGLDTYYHRAIERYGHDTARELWALSLATHSYWRAWAQQAGGVRMRQTGSYLLAESDEEARELEAAARALHADGIAVEFDYADPLGRGFHAAIYQPWDGEVQPVDLAHALLRLSGAELIPNNEVYRVEQIGDTAIVHTRQYIFHARYALLCTNAYSPFIHPYFNGRVTPTRAQCLVTEPLPEPVMSGIGYSDYGYMYYRMTFDNRLLVGGGRKLYKALENDTSEDRVTDPVQQYLDAYLRARFPDVSASVERRWAGIMGFSADGVPLVGTIPGMPRVGFAVGFTGHGLSFGAGTAERAVDHLLTGAYPGALWAGRLDGQIG
jgi:glycine/D-amino acid oxidase-like deaminating enzyme